MYVIATYFDRRDKTMNTEAIATIPPATIEAPAISATTAAILTATTMDGLDSHHSKRNYKRALVDWWRWYFERQAPVICRATLQRYRAELVAGGARAGNVNFRLAAIRRTLREAADNGVLADVAVRSACTVEAVKAEGGATGRRLSKRQAEMFISCLPATTPAELRNRALVALMLLSGIRRGEAAALEVRHFELIDARWTLRNIVGKRGKVRTVAIPAIVKALVDGWLAVAGITAGRVFRPVNKGGRVADGGMTAEAIRKIIERARGAANANGGGVPAVAAHDLRRTYARLAREAGAPLEQIQFSLGHASITTTERYTSMEQSFTNAPCDAIGLDIRR
jgi:integrase